MGYCNKCGKQIENSGHVCTSELYNSGHVPNSETMLAVPEARSLAHDVRLANVMTEIRKNSLYSDSSIIEIDDSCLEEILSHYLLEKNKIGL